MIQKITVRACTIEKQAVSKKGNAYTSYKVVDEFGNPYNSLEFFKEGEICDVEVTDNPFSPSTGTPYPKNIKKVTPVKFGKGFTPKDTKRETALTSAVNAKFPKPLSSDDLLKLADKFYTWLNK